jgi:hypothetical protein
MAPSRANFSAVARPMPWAAPVTMQTLSSVSWELQEVEDEGEVGVEVGQRVVAAFEQQAHVAPA